MISTREPEMNIEFTTENDDGEETLHVLPAKYVLCAQCEGHGTHLNPSMGQHAYTSEEFERDFDDEARGEYLKRGGIYDVQCEACKGLRVVLVVTRDACQSEQQKKALALYDERLEADRDYERLVQSEIAFGC